MKKIIFRTFISLLFLSIILILYFSTIGIKTNIFNSQIISYIKNIEPSIELKINDVSAKLNLFSFSIDAKTTGTNLISKNKIIEIENIKSKISLNSIINKKFALSEILIKSKSIQIQDLISFIRLLNNDTKLFIAEQFIKDGYVVTDIKLEFDEFGKVKSNYKINGSVNNGKISLLNKELSELKFMFEFSNKKFQFNDIQLLLNGKSISLPELIALKKDSEFLVSGKLNSKNLNLKHKDLHNFINNEFIINNLREISITSESDFKFKINKKFKFENFEVKSSAILDNVNIKNFFNLKNIFPNSKDNLTLNNQKIEIKFSKKKLKIDGSGKILLQNEPDEIKYEFLNTENEFFFDTNLKISKNPFSINLINYEKKQKSTLNLNFKGKLQNNKLSFDKISLSEDKNFLNMKNLNLSNEYKIQDIGSVKINYADKENLLNKLEIKKDGNNYKISGDSLNIDKLVSELLNSQDNKKQNIFTKNFNLLFDIKKIYLDKDNITKNLKGSALFRNNEIYNLNLESFFSNNKKINFTIRTTDNNEKITTLFSNKAKPLVDRYKFIKGFNEGDLDFYSIKKLNMSNSTLKIYNFKLKELPVLTKILTLASLQGIADLLSGEGIRFDEFEMNFTNKDNLMTINEIYAIGPAISILMEGYIEKNNLISLRGTLVPATTINKTISTIPVLGEILVGKKAGEGVFGVSFKIKGPPKDLETSVNPIKTLTPRFITRTLEKIKKN